MKGEMQNLDSERERELEAVGMNAASRDRNTTAEANNITALSSENEQRLETPEEKPEGWINAAYKADAANILSELTDDRRRAGLTPETPRW
jgi:hypothetical protein